jgi:hypothetical protein
MINGNACFAYFNKNWGIPELEQISLSQEIVSRSSGGFFDYLT